MRSDDDIRAEVRTIRRAFETGAVGFACLRPDGRLVDATLPWLEIVGKDTANYPASIVEVIHPDDRDGFLEHLGRLASGEVSSVEVTNRYLRADGSTAWVRNNVSAVSTDADTTEYLVLVGQDVTQQAQADEQNARLFEFPLCLIFIAGFDGYFKRVNAGYGRLLGWTEREMLSRPYTDFVHPDDVESLGAAIGEVLSGRVDVIDQEIRVLAKDGSYRWFAGNYRPVLEGGVMYGVAIDVTERRALEEAVSQRTIELETSNRELESFSYSVSHDLRAPLRAIDGFSQILVDRHRSELSDEAVGYLELVRKNTHRMGRLIDDLLTFARLGGEPLRRIDVAPGDVVRAALEDLKVDVAGRSVDLVLNDLPSCSADPALLRQVFVNLLSNALKFSRDREVPIVEVGCREGDAGRGPAYFVRDNGVGFDMQFADRIFGVFERLHREEEYEGTGVGLATVERIVHRHGGQVWASAEMGGGATFYFTLGEQERE